MLSWLTNLNNGFVEVRVVRTLMTLLNRVDASVDTNIDVTVNNLGLDNDNDSLGDNSQFRFYSERQDKSQFAFKTV